MEKLVLHNSLGNKNEVKTITLRQMTIKLNILNVFETPLVLPFLAFKSREVYKNIYSPIPEGTSL